jgi:mono/diheme cytochrome c family protein
MNAFFRSILLAALFFAALPSPPALAQDAQRGAYVAILGDCAACHSAPGLPPFAGGLPMNSPFGIIYTTNITPDPDSGIGRYTLEEFTRALRRGVAKDGHRLYPAMPYPDFALVSDQDAADLYAYFMHEVKPAPYRPPPTKLAFPFSQRWGMFFWNLLFSQHGGFHPRADRDEAWNRGAYIVRSLGHCGACHTARGIFYNPKGYSERSAFFLSGQALDNWFAPSLRGEPASGLGAWSERDIAAFLATGHARNTAAFGSMTLAIENSTQHFTPADRAALARYLKSLAPRGEKAAYDPAAARQADARTYPQELPGAGIYASHCARCHGAEGEGRPGIPGLAGNPAALAGNAASLVHIVLAGGVSARTAAGPASRRMPGFPALTDGEIADTLSYIRTSWGNRARRIGTGEVTVLRAKMEKDDALTRAAAARARKAAAAAP